MNGHQTSRVRSGWQIRELPWPADPVAAARACGGEGELAWLDSASAGLVETEAARHSLLCTRPLAVLEQFDEQCARLRVGGRVVAENASGWALWRAAQDRLPRLPAASWGLAPGWVGYVGFEMVRQLERLPAARRPDLGLPILRLALFDRGIVLDHVEQRVFGVAAPYDVAAALGVDSDSVATENADWVERWHIAAAAREDFPCTVFEPQRTQRAQREKTLSALCVLRGETPYAGSQTKPRLQPEVAQAEYERMVARALAYIAAGDIYQVNLAQRLRLEGIDDALTAYAAGRRANPAPYGALLRWDGGAIASFSPELFLRLRGDEVLTRPIKGTRPRTEDPERDEIYRRELLGSAKEAAELAMIIDLHRNDLGRVCEYGSVRVPYPRRIEAHPTVFHTVADVVGRLRPDCDGLALLMACFPAGSVTGVPKIRALEIIDELEPGARVAYTGAIGVLGLDGQMTCNVAIRTLQIQGDTATLHVGGGIVADSDPTAEYEETLAKGRGIVAGVMSSESRVATLERIVAPDCGELTAGSFSADERRPPCATGFA